MSCARQTLENTSSEFVDAPWRAHCNLAIRVVESGPGLGQFLDVRIISEILAVCFELVAQVVDHDVKHIAGSVVLNFRSRFCVLRARLLGCAHVRRARVLVPYLQI